MDKFFPLLSFKMIRDYENQPRPEIENHPHIRMLFESQDKRANDRQYHRDREKALQERNDLIKDAPNFALTDFWCEDCKEDFKAQSIKEVEVDWTNTTQYIAFYRTKHFCGKWCMRYTTDKNHDPFWTKSKAIRADRARGHNDMIQPHETGFQLLYGRKNKTT